MNSVEKSYTRELVVFSILMFFCLFNYFIQQIFSLFLLPINIIIFIYLILKRFNVPVLYVVICALLEEQLLGYYFGSLVTTYSLVCFIILNFNKYYKFTFILSLIIWSLINYNTNNIISMFIC